MLRNDRGMSLTLYVKQNVIIHPNTQIVTNFEWNLEFVDKILKTHFYLLFQRERHICRKICCEMTAPMTGTLYVKQNVIIHPNKQIVTNFEWNLEFFDKIVKKPFHWLFQHERHICRQICCKLTAPCLWPFTWNTMW